jgi:GT2 family glycosyltransferase
MIGGQEPKVSIIVNNYNGLHDLEQCLSSIYRSEYTDYEVVLVDCSTEGIESWTATRYPEIKLWHSDLDVGPAAARNRGLSLISGDTHAVVFLDDDAAVEPNWLNGIVETLFSDENIGAVQSLVLQKTDNTADSIGGFIDKLGFVKLPAFYSTRVPTNPIEIFFCETITAVKKTVIDELMQASSVYDSNYFQHYEDVDLCWRIWLMGYRVMLAPDSLLHHVRGVSSRLKKHDTIDIFRNTRNRITTLIKNYDAFNLALFLPSTIALEILKAVILAKSDPHHTYATLHGIAWSLLNLRTVLAKRNVVQSKLRRVKDEKLSHLFYPVNPLTMIFDYNRHYK